MTTALIEAATDEDFKNSTEEAAVLNYFNTFTIPSSPSELYKYFFIPNTITSNKFSFNRSKILLKSHDSCSEYNGKVIPVRSILVSNRTK